jgi:hypothetical protein
MDIDEWLGSKGREPAEAHGDADRFSFAVGEEDERGGMPLEPGYQSASDLSRKRPAVTHRIHSIGINQLDDGMLMLRPVEVSFFYFNGWHLKKNLHLSVAQEI